jgi:lipoprotein-anchoring transpeptidase ErfK/SrfK
VIVRENVCALVAGAAAAVATPAASTQTAENADSDLPMRSSLRGSLANLEIVPVDAVRKPGRGKTPTIVRAPSAYDRRVPMRSPRSGRTAWIAVAVGVAAVAVLAGCGGRAAKRSEGATQHATPAGLGARRRVVRPEPRPLPLRCLAATAPLGDGRVAYAAVVRRQAIVRVRPASRSRVVARLPRLDENGFAQVVGVVASRTGGSCRPQWYRVQLAVLPNETEGWVRPWAVALYRVSTRVVVDLSERRLRLYRGGRVVFETAVAIGSPATPTPLGRYFVNERWTLRDASGPFGPAALGISAHSVALQDVWVQHGPIAIHGTNEPWSIGEAASNGCIRVPNAAMRRLFPLAPAGTPVVVRA